MFRPFCHAVLFAAALLVIAPAEAHTALKSSTPTDGSGYVESPQAVELEFSAEVRLTAVVVTDQTGAALETDFAVSADAASLFTVALPPLGGGDYTVSWRALSGDGHPVEGHFTFSVLNP